MAALAGVANTLIRVQGRRVMKEQSVIDDTATKAPALDELERQVERASLFTHTALGRSGLRLSEVESFTYGLLDALLAKGVVSSDEVSAAVENVRLQMVSQGDTPN